jgi:1-acyl-sn-glycerol-3-phosphate acyltransferase
MARFRLALVFLGILAVTIAMAPVQIIAVQLGLPLARRIPVTWHRIALRLAGIRVRVAGQPPPVRPLLIVSNHISWADIIVLGSIMELCFIAKSEVTGWPGVGWLARMQRTVFVDRSRRRDAKNQNETIAARLLQGDAMVLFPEGTTGDGMKLLPFKSALFGSVHHALETAHVSHVTVQPVAIHYTRLHGLPLGRYHQARAAWPGSIALAPHLTAFVGSGAWDVDVVFCRPSDFSLDTPRKEIAATARESIRQAFTASARMRQLRLDPASGER